MKRLILLAVLAFLAWQQYGRHDGGGTQRVVGSGSEPIGEPLRASQPAPPATSSSFKCDGRIHCSQMTSCAEATFFLRNCPGVKMDGDGDGIPCEQQWC